VESEGGEGGVGRRGGNGPRPVAEPGVEHLGGAKQRLAGEGHQQPEHLSAKKGSRQPTIAARARAAWTALLSQRRTSTRLRSKLLLRTTTPSSMPPTPGAHTAPGCRTSQQTNGADAKPKKIFKKTRLKGEIYQAHRSQIIEWPIALFSTRTNNAETN
jgi:hypothetical protein